jgi:hypothetical protein
MASFIEDVRQSRVKGPTTRGFRADSWREIREDASRDELSRKLAAAGLFFSERFAEIRNQLGERILNVASSKEDFLRLVIGYQNLRFKEIQILIEGLSQPSAEPEFVESRMLREIEDDFRGTAPLDDSLRVDASSRLIRHVDGERNWNLSLADSALEAEIKEIVRLTRNYSYFEELWWECVWAEGIFDHDCDPPVLQLRQSDWGLRTAITDFRVKTTRFEQTSLAAQRWDAASGRDGWINPLVTFRESGEVLLPEIEDAVLPPSERPMDVIHAEVYRKDYSEPLMAEGWPLMEGIAIKDVLVARRVLAGLGRSLQNRLSVETSLPVREKLYSASPIISLHSLEDMLHRPLRHLSTKANGKLLQSFLWGGSAPDDTDLWYHPLIQLGDDRAIALAEPLVGLNLERVIDKAASDRNFFDKKGKHFESKFRADIASIAATGRSGVAKVHTSSIGRLRTSRDKCGDIDLLIKFGHTLLVGEVKCLRFPAISREWYNNLEELRKGCKQAARKAKAVSACLNEVLSHTGFEPGSDDAQWKVLPFVVSNQAIGVGTSFEGVPIVDRQILDSYLGHGGYYPYAQLANNGTVWDKGRFVSYFANSVEAEEKLEEYLSKPSAISRLEPFFKTRRTLIAQSDKPFYVVSLELDLVQLNKTIPANLS